MSTSPINFNSSWELNEYELERRPHEPITANTEVVISPKTVRNELLCPICLDVLKQTVCTKQCLHRFCQECITTALRSGNKECPTCRKKIVSKRSLRPDPTFDGLIAKIFPTRDEIEEHERKMSEKFNELKKKSAAAEEESEIEILLGPNFTNDVQNDQKHLMVSRFLKSAGNCSIGHIVKYLEMRSEIMDASFDTTKTSFALRLTKTSKELSHTTAVKTLLQQQQHSKGRSPSLSLMFNVKQLSSTLTRAAATL